MLFLKVWHVLLILGPTIIQAACPGYLFRCPSGESFTVNTCYAQGNSQCVTCRSINTDVKLRCPRYSCSGSVNNWYGRSNGCSGGPVTGPLANVFRSACAIHDICYSTPGRTQKQCDDNFYLNMLTTCRFPENHNIGIWTCNATARRAYEAVKKIPGNNFPNFAKTCRRY